MNHRRASFIVGSVVLIVLLLVFIFGGEENPTGEITKDLVDEDPFSNSPDYHWDHMPLTYDWNQECERWNRGNYPSRIESALNEISNVTQGIITFQKSNSNESDIFFDCDSSLYYTKGRTIAEAEPYVDEETNLYGSSYVRIYDPSGCAERPVVLIHEVLHLLGIPHPPVTTTYAYAADNNDDIMYPEKYTCDARIYDYTIDYLTKTYTNQGGYYNWNIQEWKDYNPYEFPSLEDCDSRDKESLDRLNCALHFAKEDPIACEKVFVSIIEDHWIGRCYAELSLETDQSSFCDLSKSYFSSIINKGPSWNCKVHFDLLNECEKGCVAENGDGNYKCLLRCE